LALVIFQGVLGGMRVRLDERTLAMLHGCTGPLFFALAVAMVVFTSSAWRTKQSPATTAAGPIRRLAVVTCILVYLQILLGAVLRHVPVAAEPATFVQAVRFHLFLAAVLTFHIAILVWFVLRHARSIQPLRGLAFALAVILIVQLSLGAATWVVKFAAPAWAPDWIVSSRAAIQDGGWLQTHIITAHVAVGSLLLAACLAVALYAKRLLPTSAAAPGRGTRRWEAAV
jgi:cytochrome c oxidase assembly protein subunit 15